MQFYLFSIIFYNDLIIKNFFKIKIFLFNFGSSENTVLLIFVKRTFTNDINSRLFTRYFQ